jgi:hypothetical protein
MKPLWITTSTNAMLLALLFLTVATTPGLAVEYTVGVKAGDWIKYGDISVSWNGTDTEPQSITDAKNWVWWKVEIQNVSDTTVRMTVTMHYRNGTEKPQTDSYDIKNLILMDSYYVVAADLKKGDPITTQPDAPSFNDTVTRRYAGASRSANVLDTTFNSGTYTTKFTAYWDQETGILLELFTRAPVYTPTWTATGAFRDLSIKATETNLWTADILGIILGNLFYSIVLVGALVIIIAVIIVGVFSARRKKPVATVTPTQTPTQASKGREP